VLRGEETVAPEEKELVEPELRSELLAQEVSSARVHPAGWGDDAETPSGSELLHCQEQEVVRVVGLPLVDAFPGGDVAKPVEERLVVRLGHVGRVPDDVVE